MNYIHFICALLSTIITTQVFSQTNTSFDENRILINNDLIKTAEFQIDCGSPFRLWLEDELIYMAVARGEYNIYAYDFSGTLKKRIGKDTDKDWKKNSIWYYTQNADSTYWIHDFRNARIRKHSINTGERIITKKIGPCSNVCHIGEGEFLLPRYDKAEKKYVISSFNVNNSTASIKYDFQELLSGKSYLPQNKSWLLFTGIFTNVQKNTVAYILYNRGEYLVFDTKTKGLKVIKDFREFKWPDKNTQERKCKSNSV